MFQVLKEDLRDAEIGIPAGHEGEFIMQEGGVDIGAVDPLGLGVVESAGREEEAGGADGWGARRVSVGKHRVISSGGLAGIRQFHR